MEQTELDLEGRTEPLVRIAFAATIPWYAPDSSTYTCIIVMAWLVKSQVLEMVVVNADILTEIFSKNDQWSNSIYCCYSIQGETFQRRDWAISSGEAKDSTAVLRSQGIYNYYQWCLLLLLNFVILVITKLMDCFCWLFRQYG